MLQHLVRHEDMLHNTPPGSRTHITLYFCKGLQRFNHNHRRYCTECQTQPTYGVSCHAYHARERGMIHFYSQSSAKNSRPVSRLFFRLVAAAVWRTWDLHQYCSLRNSSCQGHGRHELQRNPQELSVCRTVNVPQSLCSTKQGSLCLDQQKSRRATEIH